MLYCHLVLHGINLFYRRTFRKQFFGYFFLYFFTKDLTFTPEQPTNLADILRLQFFFLTFCLGPSKGSRGPIFLHTDKLTLDNGAVNIFSKIFLIPGLPKDFLRKALTKGGGYGRLTGRGDPPPPNLELCQGKMCGVSCGEQIKADKTKNCFTKPLLQVLPAHHAAHLKSENQTKVNLRLAIRSNRKDRQPMRSSAPESGIFQARKPTTRPLSRFLLMKRCFVGRKTL